MLDSLGLKDVAFKEDHCACSRNLGSCMQLAKGVTGSVLAVTAATLQGKLTMLPTKPRSITLNHYTKSTSTMLGGGR